MNLVHVDALSEKAPIIERFTTEILGVSDSPLYTMGTTTITALGKKSLFYVYDSPIIPGKGLLGSPFCLEHQAEISFHHKTLVSCEAPIKPIPFCNRPEMDTVEKEFRKATLRLQARSKTQVPVLVKNIGMNEGYLPRINGPARVYIGEAAVTNHNGICYTMATNANDVPVEMVITPQELEPYDLTMEESDSGEEPPIESEQTRIKRIENGLRLDHLNQEERGHVLDIIKEFPSSFHLPGDQLGKTTTLTHRITTTDGTPVHTRQYRFPPVHQDEIKKQVQGLLENGIIKHSSSPYNSPLWIVPKKPDSNGNKRWRMVIDYRGLNDKTVGDSYPLPNITEILDKVGGAKYFSVFDLASGFHQIGVDPEDQPKTAFSTPNGHYEYQRMPFGLKNAPATFQRLMDLVLSGLQGVELFVYLDDIVVYSSSLQQHGHQVRRLLRRLKEHGLTLQTDKCEFLRKEVTYLGHILSESGVKPNPHNLEAVRKFPSPSSKKNIKQFLGLAGYYRRFIPNFAEQARPMTKLLKKAVAFVWGEEQQKSFEELRDALCEEPVLQYPDFSRPFSLTTDASDHALGAVLSQGEKGEERPVNYASRTLSKAETNYSTTEKECLAVIFAINYFRPYLYGREFTLYTDHQALVWLHNVKDPSSRLTRWRLRLAEYNFRIIYKSGVTNTNADALSRNPVAQCLPLRIGNKDRDPEYKAPATQQQPLDTSSIASRLRGNHRTAPITYADKGDGTNESLDGSMDRTGIQLTGLHGQPPSMINETESENEEEDNSEQEEDSPSNITVQGSHLGDSVTDQTSQQPEDCTIQHPCELTSDRLQFQEMLSEKDPKTSQVIHRVLQDELALLKRLSEITESDQSCDEGDQETTQQRTNQEGAQLVADIDSLCLEEAKERIRELGESLKTIVSPTVNPPNQESANRKPDTLMLKGNLITPERPIPRKGNRVSFLPTPRRSLQPTGRSTPYGSLRDSPDNSETESECEEEGSNGKNITEFSAYADSATEHEDTSDEDEVRHARNHVVKQNKEPYACVEAKVYVTPETLTMRKDNCAHFISTDCLLTTPVGKQLREMGQIRPEKLEETIKGKGHVTVTKRNRRRIFSIANMDQYYHTMTNNELVMGLQALKNAMRQTRVDTIRLAAKGDGLDHLQPAILQSLITEVFRDYACRVYLCTGEIETPPLEERLRIVKEWHEGTTGGHKGVTKTYHRLRQRYHWPGMRNQVQDVIRCCESCQKQKVTRVKTREPMIITDTPVEAWEKIAIDIVGPLPKTSRGNRYILTIMDLLTKLGHAHELPDQKALTIIRTLDQKYFKPYSIPLILLTDRGRNFTSDIMKDFLKINKVNHVMTSGYHPQTNGSLERSHTGLVDYLRHYTSKHVEWDELLPDAMRCYNSTIHEGTKFTPHEMAFGKLKKTSETLPLAKHLPTTTKYMENLVTRLSELAEVGGNNLNAAKLTSKHYYDQKLNPVKFSVGDQVYVKREVKGKLDSNYEGPYEIVEMLDFNTAIIAGPNGKRKLKHLDKLKRKNNAVPPDSP